MTDELMPAWAVAIRDETVAAMTEILDWLDQVVRDIEATTEIDKQGDDQ